MDNLISRQAAIDAFQKELTVGESKGNYVTICSAIGYEGAKHILESLPSAQQWIPCSERMPEYPFGCLVTVWDTNPITMDEFENILPYFVGWDGEQWNDGEGDQCPFEVIAWLPIPEPFKEDQDD